MCVMCPQCFEGRNKYIVIYYILTTMQFNVLKFPHKHAKHLNRCLLGSFRRHVLTMDKTVPKMGNAQGISSLDKDMSANAYYSLGSTFVRDTFDPTIITGSIHI